MVYGLERLRVQAGRQTCLGRHAEPLVPDGVEVVVDRSRAVREDDDTVSDDAASTRVQSIVSAATRDTRRRK